MIIVELYLLYIMSIAQWVYAEQIYTREDDGTYANSQSRERTILLPSQAIWREPKQPPLLLTFRALKVS